jgi:hypothetical protein
MSSISLSFSSGFQMAGRSMIVLPPPPPPPLTEILTSLGVALDDIAASIFAPANLVASVRISSLVAIAISSALKS